MKESQPYDMSLKQQYSSLWGRTGLDYRDTNFMDDVPLGRAPIPSVFHRHHSPTNLTPDPLLTVTPEKSLGQAALAKRNSNEGAKAKDCDRKRSGKPRVHFAPGTITSPPAVKNQAENTSDSDSVPRSFSAVTSRLYQPGKYGDEGVSSTGATAGSSTSAPKQYTVERKGNTTVYVPMDQSKKNIISSYSEQGSGSKFLKATVVNHRLPNVEDCDTEVKEAFGRSSRTQPRNPTHIPAHRSPQNSSPHCSPVTVRRSFSPASSPTRLRPTSTSPTRPHSGSRSPSPYRSPNRHRSRSCSPNRPHYDGEVNVLPEDEDDDAPAGVRVIREAPLRPKVNDYVFPFSAADQDTGYDSYFENPLARPEFNSALKISEELKSAKAKRPDTWGTVSETLNKNQKKRTQIQEKASSKVNVQMQSGLYSGLVDLDLPLDQLCSNVERNITLKGPGSLPAPPKVPVGKEPDIMEFFSSDLQRELPDLSLTGIMPVTETLTQADPGLAFDLYRHNRSWDGLTDS